MQTRSDILTAAVWRKSALDWTTLCRRKQLYDVAAQANVVWTPEEAEATSVEERIAAALHDVRGALTVALPTDRVLLRIVDLPSTDPDELTDMCELQVDKFAPFPIEHLAISHEVLHTEDQISRVLIVATRREVVDHAAETFAAVRPRPHRIDVAIAAWWTLLEQSGTVPPAGRHGMLLVDGAVADLILVQDGQPVMMRSLTSGHTGPEEDVCTEMAEETAYSLASLESEWGARATPEITVWHAETTRPDLLISKLEAECRVTVQARSCSELPPLSEGCARRSLAPGTLDLVPPEWKTEAAARTGQRRLIQMAASLLLVWLAGVGAILFFSSFERAEIDRLRNEIAALEGPAEEVRQLRRRVESLEQYADRTHSALEVLREISAVLPEGVELTSLTYRKGAQVNIRGESARVPPIYDFFDALEQSPLFIEVKPEGVTQTPGGRRRPDFRLTARLPGSHTL